jgi:transposase-like protein
MLYCSVCGTLFSERKGTALSGCRLTEDKAVDILNHLFEQNGIRQTARLTGVDKNTVNRLAKIAGEHAEKAHRELVSFSPEHQRDTDGRKMVVRSKKGSKLRPRA